MDYHESMTGKETDINTFGFLHDHPQGLVLDLLIQPRASKNTISGIQGDALKIKLTAAPIDGAANKMCRDFLARLFKIPKSAVSIISGQTSRTKRVLIHCDEDQTKLNIRQYLKKIL